jgi:putative aldouronate transport system permease protein
MRVSKALDPAASIDPAAPAVAERTRTRMSANRVLTLVWRQRTLYLLLLPAIVLTFVFRYIPVYGLTLAFKDYSTTLGPFRSPFTDPIFYNFFFFQDPEFWYVLRNTVRISVAKFVTAWPAPIILALLLNEVRHRSFKRTIQTIAYLPHFLSWVILARIIYDLLGWEPSSPVNQIRAVFGLDPVALMGDKSAFIPLLVVSNLFKEVGWGTIIYLAALTRIDPDLYEAALADGAGRWVQLWHVTLPGMLPIIAILLVLGIPGILSAGFDQIYNLMNPTIAELAYVTDYYVLRVGLIQGNYAFAAAMGLVFSVIALVLVLTANWLSKRSAGTGIW